MKSLFDKKMILLHYFTVRLQLWILSERYLTITLNEGQI